MPKKKNKKSDWIEGSDNVFRDFNMKNPETKMLKSSISIESYQVIKGKKLDLEQAQKLGIPKKTYKKITKGKAMDLTLEQLLWLLKCLNLRLQFQNMDNNHVFTKGGSGLE